MVYLCNWHHSLSLEMLSVDLNHPLAELEHPGLVWDIAQVVW